LPENTSSPKDVQQHVEAVLADPTYVLPGNDPGHVVLIRRNGRDKLVAERFDLRHRSRDYWVRSAYTLTEGKLEGIFNAIRQQGGAPESLEFAQLPEAPGQALLAVAPDSSPADRLIKIARGEIIGHPPSGSDTKYSLFNLRRQAAPQMAQPPQTTGTDLQREIIRKHIRTTDVPFRQRIRDANSAENQGRVNRRSVPSPTNWVHRAGPPRQAPPPRLPRAHRDWEQGRSEPDQPARAHLMAIAGDPEGVLRALQGAPTAAR
jgi:hypothetical protein